MKCIDAKLAHSLFSLQDCCIPPSEYRTIHASTIIIVLGRILNPLQNLSLWVIKLSVGIYMIKLTDQFWAAKSLTSTTHRGRHIKEFLGRHLKHVLYTTLGVSFAIVVLTEMLECQPFSHYWQVIPDPGSACRQAYVHVLTMGIFNILTDSILVGLPMPMMMDAKLPWKLKAEFLLLVSFPLINIAFTLYRVLDTVNATNAGSQPVRTMLASVDILVATATANTLVVVSFLQDRGFKKPKYRHAVADGPIERPLPMEMDSLGFSSNGTRTNMKATSVRRQWDSDEDLMRDVYRDTAPVTDNGESVTTTDTTGSSLVETTGNMDCIRVSTHHLSPHQTAETHITTAQVGQVGDADDLTMVTLPEPIRRSSCAMHIVVETSWQVTTRDVNGTGDVKHPS